MRPRNKERKCWGYPLVSLALDAATDTSEFYTKCESKWSKHLQKYCTIQWSLYIFVYTVFWMAKGKQRRISKIKLRKLSSTVFLFQAENCNLWTLAEIKVQENAVRLYLYQLVILQIKLAREREKVTRPIITNNYLKATSAVFGTQII